MLGLLRSDNLSLGLASRLHAADIWEHAHRRSFLDLPRGILMRNAVLMLMAVTVVGCASTVHKSDSSAPTPASAAPGRPVVLNITGSTVAITAKDWNDFKALWPERCTHEASAAGVALSVQQGHPAPTGTHGTLVVIDVADYRYVSTGARIAFGVMTGNAYINANVTFRDLKSGDVLANKTYDTTSSAWGSIFSGMTTKQVTAMCREIFADDPKR
jgi:hypothetical protein